MKTRRLCTLLLALMLCVSMLAVTASAEEMDSSPYLCFSWLDNYGDGWFENTDRDWYHDNRGFGMTALDEMWQMYYYATWNGSEWAYTPIDPAQLVTENLTVTPFRDFPEDEQQDTMGSNTEYFCRVRANDWGDASISYTLDDGTELTMGVSVQRNEDGFYSSPVLNNDTYINRYRVNPLADENVFYFGFQSTYWKLKDVELYEGCDQYATLEPTDKNNVYKITVKPEVAQNVWNSGGFDVSVSLTVYNDEDPENYREEVWTPGIWCEPVWQHEIDFDAKMTINHEEYNILGDAVMRHYISGTDSDDEGNTWEVWTWEKTELPEGVSYDANTNTLTLRGANLNQLVLTHHWVDTENGNEGWDLPNGDLTIELIGENSIVSDNGWALGLGDNVNATITGDGSLYLKTTNEIRQNENGDYYADYTVNVWSGSSLTIAGNANVTAEIAGEGWNGNEEWHEQAYLQAIEMGLGDLTLCDNAVLTTVVPEGALASGTESHPDDPWYFPGGYGGIGGIGCLTVNDNATLNTTNLEFHDHWLWDEEKQEDYYVGSGRLVLNGGTVNINAIPELSYQEIWEWDEESQTDVMTGTYNRYDFRGLSFWDNGTYLEMNGGELNVTIAPTEEQYETGVDCVAINTNNGDLTVGGGTVNLNVPNGCGLNIGGWDENGTSTFTMTGGEINMTEGLNWVEIAPYGSANLNGGSIHIANGELTLCTNWEYIEEADTHVRTAYPTVVIDGANVIIDNGHLNMDGDLILNSGMLSVTQQGDPNRGPDDYVWLARANGNLTVNGGELNLIGNDVNAVFETYGDVHQTGGDIRCIINESDEWREYCRENWGYTPRTYAFQSYANVTIDGGFFVGYGHYGVSIFENGDNKLVVNGGEVVANGEMNGIMLYQDAEFNGGMVRAISRGRLHTTYNGETGEPLDFYAGNAIALTDGVNLTINGGDHWVDGYINEGYPKATYGINLFGGAVEFNGGSVMLNADFAVASFSQTEPGNPFTFGTDMCIYSLNDGCQPKLLEDVYYDYMYDENGNVIFDEEGNPVYDESVVYYDYWLEEDGIYEGGVDEYLNPANHALITSSKCGDDATWSLEDGVLTVSGTGAIYDYSDHLYTGIAPWMWLHDNNLIKTIVLDEGITAIGDYAFWHRAEVEAPVAVSIGVNVETIGENAFASDAKLTVVCGTAGETYATENGLEATVVHQFVNGKCSRCGLEQDSPFTDVPVGSFYFDPVVWALENGVTTGATETTFNPNGTCLRAHVVTFLWRAAGSPEPTSASNPFVDVKESDFYYKAVLWAVENGITNGVSATHFGPFAECNRAQVVTFLYRAMGKPAYTAAASPFKDVTETDAFYYDAVLWAVENGITNGMGDGTFGISTTCNRAQVVTFLYRAYVKK